MLQTLRRLGLPRVQLYSARNARKGVDQLGWFKVRATPARKGVPCGLAAGRETVDPGRKCPGEVGAEE